MSSTSISSHAVITSNEDEKRGKLITTLLLGLTYLTLGCVQKLPSATASLLGVQLGPVQERTRRRLRIAFNIRQMGYMFGFICGGVAADYFVLPMEKQALISVVLAIMALSCVLMPYFMSIIRIGVTLFVSGISMTFVSATINSYIMGLYGVNSNTGIQFIYAWNLIGKVITTMGTRIDYRKFSVSSNMTHTYETRREAFTKLFISYSTLGVFITVLAVAWICLYRFSPKEFRSHVPFDDNRQEKSTLGFQTLAVVTTIPMLMSASFLDFVYELMIRAYATSKFGRIIYQEDYVISFYYISLVFGRQLAVVLAYKLLTPGWMITLDLIALVIAASLMPLFGTFEETLMWVVIGLVGLSNASLIPTTLAWLNTHIMVTGKIIGCLYAASVATLLTIPIWVDETLSSDPDAPFYYMLSVPLFYASIFAIQILLFRREQSFGSSDHESSDSIQHVHRIQASQSQQETHTCSRHSIDPQRAQTVP